MPAAIPSPLDSPDLNSLPAIAEAGRQREPGSTGGALLVLLDIVVLAATAALFAWLLPQGRGGSLTALHAGSGFTESALLCAVLAPFFLYDRRFGLRATHGQHGQTLRWHLLRFAIFAAALVVLDSIAQHSWRLSDLGMAAWLTAALALTMGVRLVLGRHVHARQRRGNLRETVAVIGSGAASERLVQDLRGARAGSVELLGVFDDEASASSNPKVAGSLTQLLELGKRRRIDWILLPAQQPQDLPLQATVTRLKALSASIGLYPSPSNPEPLERHTWHPDSHGVEGLSPRWCVTLLWLPLMAATTLYRAARTRIGTNDGRRTADAAASLVLTYDDLDVTGYLSTAAAHGQQRYGYVVTPNVDHVIRLHDNAGFRASYAGADHVLNDSRFLSHLLRVTRGVQLPVCAGSDMTAQLFESVVRCDDGLVLIGASARQADWLRQRHGLTRLAHFDPPMGFIHDAEAVEACLRFIETHSPFRFCLLAVGSPQQEVLAERLQQRNVARGLALCIGASINFLTGDEHRAPAWMQKSGIEWAYRLVQSPGRMWKRYLVRGPRVFLLLRHARVVLRRPRLDAAQPLTIAA